MAVRISWDMRLGKRPNTGVSGRRLASGRMSPPQLSVSPLASPVDADALLQVLPPSPRSPPPSTTRGATESVGRRLSAGSVGAAANIDSGQLVSLSASTLLTCYYEWIAVIGSPPSPEFVGCRLISVDTAGATLASVGTPLTVPMSHGEISLTALGSSAAILCYVGAGPTGQCVLISVGSDGTSLSAGTALSMAATPQNVHVVNKLDASTAIVCSKDSANNGVGKCAVLTVSGTSLSMGTPITLEPACTSCSFSTSARAQLSVALSASTAVVCYSMWMLPMADGMPSQDHTRCVAMPPNSCALPRTRRLRRPAASDPLAHPLLTQVQGVKCERHVAQHGGPHRSEFSNQKQLAKW